MLDKGREISAGTVSRTGTASCPPASGVAKARGEVSEPEGSYARWTGKGVGGKPYAGCCWMGAGVGSENLSRSPSAEDGGLRPGLPQKP